ncbi:spike base protein, RCAP_Rcc01079 family [Cupriavidus basilensis]|uniref:spike base protein, RCAP_Rcc01079 family n=1 Tax=Cupriavidus basilensis TaxID=68895 RepID=UPI00284D5EF4|nr:hypothetical protein [Cupriavidus basilensis]MDR3381726.1 hypothetical protein [Cupriavidus basilensis]
MPPNDRFATQARSVSDPSEKPFPITPHDTNDFTDVANGIRVGSAGDVMVVRLDGVVVPFKNCMATEVLPVRARRVNLTGTTASDLVGL